MSPKSAIIFQTHVRMEDERQAGLRDAAKDALLSLMPEYVLHMSFGTLMDGMLVVLGLTQANDVQLVGLVWDGCTEDVNLELTWERLEQLPEATLVVFVVVTRQPYSINRKWLEKLLAEHPKAAQLRVAYFDHDSRQLEGTEELRESIAALGMSATS